MADDQFERDPRRIIELEMRPAIDVIYQSVFGMAIEIDRRSTDTYTILDRQHAIDVTIKFPCGLILLGQEKALTTTFDTLTVEYEQDQWTHEQGDWFKLAVQFYFCGYRQFGSNYFRKWRIVDWLQVVLATHRGDLDWQMNVNKDGRAKASFRYVKFDAIPDYCVIAKS